jgi:hypothetical protein
MRIAWSRISLGCADASRLSLHSHRIEATFGGVAFRLKKLKEKTATAVGREKK